MSRRRTSRRGFTLVELLVSVGAASVLLVGLASSIYIASASLDQDLPTRERTLATERQADLLTDLRHATAFTERTANAVTVVVPDRTGDGRPDTIRYAWSGTAGDPLTYAVNGGTAVTAVADVHQFGLTYEQETIVAPVVPDDTGTTSSGVVMFVSAGALNSSSSSGFLAKLFVSDTASDPNNFDVTTTAAEQERISLLETWGYTVNKIGAAQSDADFQSALGEADLVYVSSEPLAVLAGDKIVGTSLGIVCENAALVDQLGFADEVDNRLTDANRIDSIAHYVTEDSTAGSLVLFTSPQFLSGLRAPRAPGLTTLASLVNGSNEAPSLCTLAPGAALYGGGTAAGRRVLLPWSFPSSSIANLSTEGRDLLRRSVDWASGEGDDGDAPTSSNFGYESEMTVAYKRSRNQLATRATLDAAGTLTSITAFVGGKSDGVRFAVYSDNAGEPGTLLAESAAGISSDGMGWVTLPVPSVSLSAGDYWLALSFEHDDQALVYDPGGQSRIQGTRAVTSGFAPNWGASTAGFATSFSIYATYVPQ